VTHLRTFLLLALALGTGALVSAPRAVHAQPPRAEGERSGEEGLDAEEDDAEEGDEDAGDEPALRAPSLEALAIADDEDTAEDGDDEDEDGGGDEEDDAAEEPSEDEADEERLPDPERVEERLDGAGTDPTVAPWTTPETIFELHGYMRMRGEFQDQFSLGRSLGDGRSDAPFDLWIPYDDNQILMGAPSGGCAGASGMVTAPCNQRALAYANMRLRLEPTVHLSDDVRVRMQLDIFDNLVMGSTPNGYGTLLGVSDPLLVDSYVPLLSFSQTQVAPAAGINSFSDSIIARRAWAEVRNRGLGELRFGRMGNHWGLGLLANDGRGLDQDFQSDVDRIMILTRLFGLYLFGAWDFASEGMIYYPSSADRMGLSYDRGRNDDVDQMTFGVARRLTPEETTLALERHEVVLNGGLYFVYRTQNLTTEIANPGGISYGPRDVSTAFVRRGFEAFVPDLWGQLLWDEHGSATPDLRLEFEAVAQFGTIGNTDSSAFDGTSRRDMVMFGFAFEGEYHLLNDQLGIYFHTGFASGDRDAEGLTLNTAYHQRATSGGATDRTISTMAFHPAYRVDLIFWRNIMRQVAGAYYFRPGLSYDFIRTSFGQLLGARADVIWSRASEPIQTWGNQADLGVEIDAQVYYRSEDGPDLLDGFYASLAYGIFFPLPGVGYLPDVAANGGQNAQTLRLVLGVNY